MALVLVMETYYELCVQSVLVAIWTWICDWTYLDHQWVIWTWIWIYCEPYACVAGGWVVTCQETVWFHEVDYCDDWFLFFWAH